MASMLRDVPENPHDVISKSERATLRRQAVDTVRRTTALDPKRDAGAFGGAVSKRYYELLADAQKVQGLVSRQAMMAELQTLSQWWKPFDVAADPAYTEYRYRPAELYADAMSVLLNAPTELSARAPVFDRMWRGYLQARPEAALAWRKVQEELLAGPDGGIGTLRRRTQEGFRRGAEAYAKQYEQEKLTLGAGRLVLETALSSRAAPVAAAERRARKGGADFTAAESPMRLIEKSRYAASVMEGYTRAVANALVKPLQKQGLALELFDEYLLAKRVQGDRADLANPGGLRPESAGQVLQAMEQQIGAEGMAAFEAAAARLADIREEWVIVPLERAGVFQADVIKQMRDNKSYVRFDVVDYLDKAYGAGAGLKIHTQVGTLKEIASPLAATMMRDMGFIGAVLRNDARRGMVRFLERFEPGAAVAAETRWVNNHMEALPPGDPRTQGQIAFLDDGQMHTYNVDRNLARAFEGFDQGAYAKLIPIMSAIGDVFRTLYIHVRPGYPLFNLIRDTLRTIVNAPGHSAVWKIPANQAQAFRQLWAMKSGETPPLVEEMLKNGELLSRADRTELLRFDQQVPRLLAQFGLEPNQGENEHAPGWARLLGAGRRQVERFNEVIERMTKVAAEKYLREQFPNMPPAEREHRVRTQLGSPDFLERGSATAFTNNVILFSNAAVQGWKSDIEAMRNDKAVVAKRLALFVPYKVLTWALKTGAAVALARLLWPGDDEDGEGKIKRLDELHALYQAIPERDQANYLCVPLGVARLEDGSRGQVLYLRLPMDETTRMMNGMLHYSLETMAGKAATPGEWVQILRVAADQLPSVNPVLELASGALQMLAGKNPIDSWTRRPVVDQRVFEARSTPEANAWTQYGQWAWQKAGLGVFYNIPPEWKGEEPQATGLAGMVQKIDTTPGLALIDDIVGRFLKVSDYGRATAQQKEAMDPLTVEAARHAVVRADLARRVAAGEDLAGLSEYETSVWKADSKEIMDRARATLSARGLPADLRAIYDAPKAQRPYLEQWQADNPRP
jgi:hypothetical protein